MDKYDLFGLVICFIWVLPIFVIFIISLFREHKENPKRFWIKHTLDPEQWPLDINDEDFGNGS